MIRHLTLSFGILAVITYKFGILGGLFSITQALMCALMIETVNYVEHYGLLREKDSNGNYEPVSIKHSWNAP